MQEQKGWVVTGFRTYRGRDAVCLVGTRVTYKDADAAADEWLAANRQAVRVDIEREYWELP